MEDFCGVGNVVRFAIFEGRSGKHEKIKEEWLSKKLKLSVSKSIIPTRT